MNNQSWTARDLRVVWHPCTQMKDHEQLPLIPIQRGKGIWLYDFDGNRYLDAVSSWWVNLFGHANTRINNAIKAQLDELEHVILAGFSHAPAIELAERLVHLTPTSLTRCFYVDNGSSAIEAALKMSFHAWLNQGKKNKSKFVTLSNSYHGETLGALAVGDVGLYKKTYQPLLMDVITAPSPDCFNRESGQSWSDHSLKMIEPMRKILEAQCEQISAVIVEPLIQCAGSMRMYHAIYLTELRKLCTQYEVHLIADEIAVGFGRTGTLFACEQANISPDFMCLSKGITGGYLPLSVVLTSDPIYQLFYAEYDTLKAFLHSHSYTGNALACRAAIASLDIFESDRVLENNQQLAEYMRQATQPLIEHDHVAEIRQTGMVVAIELVKNKQTKQAYDWRERRGMRVYEYALSQEVLLRPLGNVVYFMPPYIITEAQIDHLVEVASRGIELATQN